jgi:hypothetical protein
MASLEMTEVLTPVSIRSQFVHRNKFTFSQWLDKKLYVARFILKNMVKAEITNYTYFFFFFSLSPGARTPNGGCILQPSSGL